MRRVSHHHDLTVLGLQKSILEGAGISAFILNNHSWWMGNGAVSLLCLCLGERELTNNPLFAPVLCIVEDAYFEEALEILVAHHAALPQGTDWTCHACAAEVPGTLDACWQCRAEQPTEHRQ